MNNNPDIAVIGFGGCGFNVINEFSRTDGTGAKLALLGEDVDYAHADNEITFYTFDKINVAAQEFSGIRLCFLVGGLGGNSCVHIAPFSKKLREMGIVVFVLVTFPLRFEGRNEKATGILETLQSEADAVFLFPNDEYMKKSPTGATMAEGMVAAHRDIMACMMAICCSRDDLICIDAEDLRSQLHGLILHGVGRSKMDAASAAREAVDDVKAHLSQNTEIGSMLIYAGVPTGQNDAEEINMCCATVMQAFPENPHILLTAKKNMEGDGFTVVLLACQSALCQR